ncbi:MAG: two-component sensor histidine kinase [Cryobacterium sp.]|nr:two-component sensor histidine kinase [Cryobacterium sp.]MCO5294712.1 ATP-binding protein [Homoserinimonas sp.]MCW5944245.1 two-component sensor histidine kinase [Cryobacterium sp.]
MDPVWLVLGAVAFGAVLGAGVVLIVSLAGRRGDRAVSVVTPSVPDGVDEVIEALDSAALVLDPSNNVLRASEAALAFGLVRNNLLENEDLVKLADETRRSGESVTREVELPRRFGEAAQVLRVRAAMLGTRYTLLLAEDRTESHRLDAVRRDFVANISHELKTPIGAVSLLAEALQAAAKDPEQVKKFAKRLTKESDRLGRITEEIIELSRLQAEDALKTPQVVEVDAVVAAAVDQNRVAAESRRITVASGGTEGLKVYGDKELLIVALQNLVSNAIIYSPKDSRVGVGVSAQDGQVEIAVTDQGIGLEASELERVFERFYRVDPARSRVTGGTGGTGLGLSIVKHVVQNHGGEVRVWSKPRYGSTFTIRLPEAEALPAEKRQ